MRNTIHISGIQKSYNKGCILAVNNIDLTIDPGNIIAVAGNSGSGKTTLLRLISGFEQPDSGEIRIDDRLICNQDFNAPPENRNVGVVFQEYALFPHLSILENIKFGISTYTKKEQAQRIGMLAELAEVTSILHRYPHEISGGQQQRVALLRALAPNPSIVLMDEPFNGLDTALKLRILPLILKIIRNANTSALVVTHNREEAFMLADKIALLYDGGLRQYSTPRILYEEPQDSYAAEFFGPANLLPATTSNNTLHCALGSIPFSLLRKAPTADSDKMQAFLLIRPGTIVLQEPGIAPPPTACPHLSARAVLDKNMYYGDYSIARMRIINKDNTNLYMDAHILPNNHIQEKKQYNVFIQSHRYHIITAGT